MNLQNKRNKTTIYRKKQHTLQIASISSKIMTCNSLWSPVLRKSHLGVNKIEILDLKYHNIYITPITVGPLIILSISKKISHILFGFPNELAQHFRAIDNLTRWIKTCGREHESKQSLARPQYGL